MGDATRCAWSGYGDHEGPCDPSVPQCGFATNHIDGALRRGSEPDWPWERGGYSAALLDIGGLVRFHEGAPWGREGMFVVSSRRDCDDLTALLQVVRERLPR